MSIGFAALRKAALSARLKAVDAESQDVELQVISLDQIKLALNPKVVQELEIGFKRKRDAGGAYGEACKSIAKKAGIKPAVLKAWIAARVNDQAARASENARQLQLLFDEIGL